MDDDSKSPPAVPPVALSLIKLGNIQTFNHFALRIADRAKDFHFWMYKRKKPGQTIAGYGASPTSTTLIYRWDLGEYLDYLIDDWPAKQGTFSPGLHLPVYKPSVLIAEPTDNLWHPPDYCVILAWRYAEQIMARNPQFRGTWIVPLPELRVIKSSSLATGSGTLAPAAMR